jgi:hypothetical protein
VAMSRRLPTPVANLTLSVQSASRSSPETLLKILREEKNGLMGNLAVPYDLFSDRFAATNQVVS